MGIRTNVAWATSTWNPWQGCTKKDPLTGCANCYMYREKKRYGQDPTVVVRSADRTFNLPLRIEEPSYVFVCSWSDFFHKAADGWREEAWNIIRATPHLTYQIPTKRPERIEKCLPPDWGDGWPHVWLGISAATQQELDRRTKILFQNPANRYFLSLEPLLEPVYIFLPRLLVGPRKYTWIITGGESGDKDKIRPADLNWFREIRDACMLIKSFGEEIFYFHKQHGGHKKINGAWGGLLLDGVVWSEIPPLAEANKDDAYLSCPTWRIENESEKETTA